MGKITAVKRSPTFYRLAFFTLLVMAMVTTTLHLGAVTAQAAQASLSWTPTTTNADGTPITDLAGYNVYIGSAAGSYQQKINVGNVASYTATNLTAGSTSYFAVTAYDTSGLESGYSNVVNKTMPSTSYVITATAGSGGTITALNNTNVSVATNGTSTITSANVSSGANQSFSIAASSAYKVSDVQVDGTSVGPVTSYTFNNVTANHSISATFTAAASSYTITASAGSNGTISPSGSTSVTSGGSQSYKVTPNTGYYISSVAVDGTTVASNVAGGAGYSYTFSNVTANHTISATFAFRYYNLVGTAGSNGSVSPANTWILYNTSQTVAITPSSGYKVASVTVDGASVGPVTSYTFSNVSADHTISATFSTTTSYTITASAGSNGTISPSGSTAVTSGGSQSYTVTPNTGYYVASIVVDGTTIASNIPSGGYTYTFSNVTGNHTISATFAIRYYNIVATAGSNGSASPTNTWEQYNNSQTISITPNSGHKIANVTVDGVSVGAVSSYTFKNVSSGHTLVATFL